MINQIKRNFLLKNLMSAAFLEQPHIAQHLLSGIIDANQNQWQASGLLLSSRIIPTSFIQCVFIEIVESKGQVNHDCVLGLKELIIF